MPQVNPLAILHSALVNTGPSGGIRVVGKNEKLESFKLESLKLESLAEVGKNRAKLERTERSWKELSEVGKNPAKLESFF